MDQYREGKVERTPNRGVKKNLKPFVYKRSEPERATACLLHNEPTSCVPMARLRPSGPKAVARASLKRAMSHWEQTRNLVIYP